MTQGWPLLHPRAFRRATPARCGFGLNLHVHFSPSFDCSLRPRKAAATVDLLFGEPPAGAGRHGDPFITSKVRDAESAGPRKREERRPTDWHAATIDQADRTADNRL
jgi:hypothetical protein